MINPVDAKINGVADDRLGVSGHAESYALVYGPVSASVEVIGFFEIDKAIRTEVMRT